MCCWRVWQKYSVSFRKAWPCIRPLRALAIIRACALMRGDTVLKKGEFPKKGQKITNIKNTFV